MTEDDAFWMLNGYVEPPNGCGFALPCYRPYRRPDHPMNSHAAALCLNPGDPLSRISGFDDLQDTTPIVDLPQDKWRRTEVGDQWRDVFLWNNEVFVGTAKELWSSVVAHRAEIAREAPLSLLQLSSGVAAAPHADLARTAFAFVLQKQGPEAARRWRDRVFFPTYLRWRCERSLIHPNGKRSLYDDAKPAVSVIKNSLVRVEIPPRYAREVPERDLSAMLDEMSDYAWGFDLEFDSSYFPPAREHSLLTPDPSRRPNHPATMRALIVAAGPRAEFISRYMRAPSWLPMWEDGQRELPKAVQVTQIRGESSQPKKAATVAIDVCSLQRAPASLTSYNVIVGLIDDDGGGRGYERARFLEKLTKHGDAVVLLAPALPAQYPSEILTDRRSLPAAIDAVVDTSLARTPAPARATERSADRRIADITIEAALLSLHAPLVAEMRLLRSQGATPVMAVATARAGASRSATIDHQLASEATWAEVNLFRSSVGHRFAVYDLGKHERAPGKGMVELRTGASDFPDFAMSVVRRISDQTGGGEWARSSRGITDDLLQHLRFPEMSVLATGPAARKDSTLLVLAEAPSLPALRTAERLDLQLVRYTDEYTLRRVIKSGGRKRWTIPGEVRLEEVYPLAQNDRLVSRGADKRDILAIGAGAYSAWKQSGQTLPPLLMPRPLRGTIDDRERDVKQYAAPLEPLYALARQEHPGAISLFAAAGKTPEPRTGAFKRPGDLRRAWSPPPDRFERFAISDGALPVRVSPFRPDDLAAQTLFIIDGDWAAVALFESPVFDVWARATLTQPSVWQPRFSIRATFDTFPILPDMIDPYWHCIAARPSSALAETCARYGDKHTLPERNEDSNETATAKHHVDEMILHLYGLRLRSSEIEILERLIELNRELRGGRPALI